MTDSSPPRDRDTQADWERIRARLRAELGDASFASWLAPLTLVDVDGEEVTLGVATRFLRDWIESHYADRIATLWADHRPGIQTARIVIHDGLPPDTDGKPHTAGERPQARRDGALGRRVHDERLDSLGSPLNNHLTFREFVVGESNELAHAAAQQVAGVDHLRSTRSTSTAVSGTARPIYCTQSRGAFAAASRPGASSTSLPNGSCIGSFRQSGRKTR